MLFKMVPLITGGIVALFSADLVDSSTAPVEGEAITETQPPAEPEPAADMLQIRAKEVWLGDGSRIEGGVLLVEAGKIRKVGRGVDVDERYAVIDHDGVITPGIVALSSQYGAAGEAYDETRTVLPDARMAYAFDPGHPDFARALGSGITSLVLAPTAENLAGGLTAVVKTSGGSVLSKEAHLALSFAHESLSGGPAAFSFFFGEADLRADGGIEFTSNSQRGSRTPTSYSGAMRELRDRFGDPEGVFGRAARGELPVLIEAWDRNEVARAANFAKQYELTGALRGAPLAADEHLLPMLQASGLGVVLGPYGAGQKRRSLESAKALMEAGVPFAFALGGAGTHPDQLRLSAVMAVDAGANANGVFKGLTSDAAAIAGVADRVGMLERGRDADFILWNGDPLNLTTKIVAVYVDGERVHEGASK